jgi:TonB family protein
VHEVAHVRRYDVWTNALARVAEALVALNPSAWFVMRRLSAEREIACDDWVVERTGSGDTFATVLAGLARTVGRNAPLGAPSAFGSRHSIVVRIERLLDARPRRLRLSVSALTATLASLALIAVLMQSVSPVLAYDVHQPAVAHAAAVHGRGLCTVPDRGIRLVAVSPWQRFAVGHGQQGVTFELQPAAAGASWSHGPRAATANLTVNAAGRATGVTLVSPGLAPGVANDVKRALMNNRYLPATRHCEPITSTARTAVFAWRAAGVGASVVAPVYPKGWSTRYASACKVPSLVHSGVPAIPPSLRKLTTETTLTSAVRVDVDAAGTVTKATIVTPSGQPDFDESLLLAARSQEYPLTESSGFRPVRPAHASLDWNAVHGSNTYTSCKPLPTGYVWTGTFVASHTELFFPAGAFVQRQTVR